MSWLTFNILVANITYSPCVTWWQTYQALVRIPSRYQQNREKLKWHVIKRNMMVPYLLQVTNILSSAQTPPYPIRIMLPSTPRWEIFSDYFQFFHQMKWMTNEIGGNAKLIRDRPLPISRIVPSLEFFQVIMIDLLLHTVDTKDRRQLPTKYLPQCVSTSIPSLPQSV